MACERRPIDLHAALRAVTLAREVERLSEGYAGMPVGKRRAKRQELMRATEQRILEAVHAGASTADVAEALGQNLSWTRKRIQNAKLAAGEPVATRAPKGAADGPTPLPSRAVTPEERAVVIPPELLPILGAPKVWLEVPRCGALMPPPWPVWARCNAQVLHNGPHASVSLG